MTAPSLAAYWVLGVCLFGSPFSAQSQKYPVPQWEPCSDGALADAFEKSTGQKAWKVLWQDGAFQKSESDPIVTAVVAAWVVGLPEKVGTRLGQGRVGYLWKAASPGQAWFPGEPFVWKDLAGEPNEALYPTRYVMAHAPESAAIKGHEDLAERIYDRPVLCDAEVPIEESLALLDATFQELVKGRNFSGAPAGTNFDGQGKPHFAAVVGISARDRYIFPEKHPNRRFIMLSEGGDGYAVFAFERKDGGFVLAEVGGAEF